MPFYFLCAYHEAISILASGYNKDSRITKHGDLNILSTSDLQVHIVLSFPPPQANFPNARAGIPSLPRVAISLLLSHLVLKFLILEDKEPISWH